MTAAIDLTCNDVHFRLESFDAWSEEELYLQIGAPQLEHVDSTHLDASTPRYAVDAARFAKSSPEWLSHSVLIMNFEFAHTITESFNKANFKMPDSNPYAAPELLLGLKFMGNQVDIWALGCIIYEIRSGQKPFDMDSSVEPAEAMAHIARTLGKLPENWAQIPFDWCGQVQPVGYVDPDGRPCNGTDETIEYPLMTMICDIDGEETQDIKGHNGKISKREAECLYGLLRKMLVCQPESRISAQSILRHPWFRRRY